MDIQQSAPVTNPRRSSDEARFIERAGNELANAIGRKDRAGEFEWLDEIETVLLLTDCGEIRRQGYGVIQTHAPYALDLIKARVAA